MNIESKKKEIITDGQIEQLEFSIPEKNRLRGEIDRIRSLWAQPLENITETGIGKEEKRLVKEIIANSDILEKALQIEKEFYVSIEILNQLIKYELPETQSLTLSIFERNLPIIENYIKSDKNLFNYQCLSAINNLAMRGSAGQQEIGVEALSRHTDSLAFSMNFNVTHLYFPFIETLVKKGGAETAQEALSILKENLFFDEKFGVSDYILLSQSFTNMHEDIRGIADTVIKKELSLYKLDNIQKFIDAWHASMPPTDSSWMSPSEIEKILKANIKAIQDIETQRRGSTSFLNKEFGIFDFGRYPVEMLISQYDDYNNDAKPYGVIFNPRDDNNGAFYDNAEVFRQLFEQLNSNNFLIRAAEGEDKIDIVKLLHKLDRRYGKKHKISFAIIGGHGSWDSIKFGGNDRKHTLNMLDLFDKKHPAFARRKFFEDSPIFILNSCSTGAEYGIAEQLSYEMGATVIAPSEPTSLKSIDAEVKGGKLRFYVEYGKSNISTVYAIDKKHENLRN